MDSVRIWKETDVADIEKHILIIDEKLGFCPGCRQIGINIQNIKNCPSCKREIKYITVREARANKGIEVVTRLMQKLPDKIFIDFDDYERVTRKNKAEGLFSGI